MSSATTALLNHHGPLSPSKGTLPIAANTLLIKNAMVGMNTSGNAVNPADTDTSGNPIIGVSSATYDNRTNSEMGGLAASGQAEVQFGVVSFAFTGTTPLPFDKLYAVDNQTVSTDSLSGTRGLAGICTEVRTLNGVAKAFFWCGPAAIGALAPVNTASLPAFAAGDSAVTTVVNGMVYDVPATAANSTISLPANPRDGIHATIVADGTKNGHTLTLRDVATAITAASTASKRVLFLVRSSGGKWFADMAVGP